MDPSATWKTIAESWDGDVWDECKEAAQNLLDWLKKGGFPPKITGFSGFDRAISMLVCQKILLKGEFKPTRKAKA